ncbi:MAG: aminotransferase class I/II-fold pyridoxal phosphate-dependent enzyme [Chitinophagia bacterium]|nr:aminotransferase class I/II-fold pyridoxal phosphate-dependent enzyme [Chitinophagia bacterium]NCA30765.1 aminotransferase class I/II-fold pyridoxal phosphate-dependent enzyme [Chitinophagia bacterium]
MIDFRSDTVTLPTPAMLAFMQSAPLGDDVFGEDPSINALEAKTAGIFGMEAGLFCPSGTMTNQLAIKTHTQAGDEVICEELSHIYQYEGGGIASNSGSSVKLLRGNRGRITAEQVLAAINPDDVHKPISKLVSLENTCNRGGGACYDFSEIEAIQKVAKSNGLGLHLDGARIFNAIVHKNEDPKQYGKVFDSISICLSKGLGAPVGSVLLGSAPFIKKARRWRKVFGGGMRQAGSLAAAGIYALDNHIERLKEDHSKALKINDALLKKDFVKEIFEVETNIVIAHIEGKYNATQLAATLKEKNISVIAMTPQLIRFVVHLDITNEMLATTIETIEKL